MLGAGELRSGGAQRGAVLADAVEALIGAVLLDGGTVAAEALIDLLFAEQIRHVCRTRRRSRTPKTRLQEWLQGKGLRLPSLRVRVGAAAAITSKHSSSVATVEEKDAHTTGQGPSRRRAEQEAAAAMLSVLTGERDG